MADSSVIRKLDTPIRRIPGPFRHRSFIAAIILGLLVIAGISLLKRQDMDRRQEECLREAEVQLSHKAQVRRDRVLGIVQAARAHARMMAAFPSFREVLVGDLSGTATSETQDPKQRLLHVGAVMESMLETQELAAAALIDASGRLLVRRDRVAASPPDARFTDLSRKVLLNGAEDLVSVDVEGGPWLLIAHPLSGSGNESPGEGRGVIVLAVDPNQWRPSLDPMVFPEFPTEEVVLALWEGDRLRPVISPPLATDRTGVMDILVPGDTPRTLPDRENLLQWRGADYRGKAVLAAIASIPDLPLAVVVKIDQEQVLLPVRAEKAHFFWILGLVVALVVLVLLLMARHFRSVAFRRMLEVENRYRVLAEQARDIILVISTDGHIIEANRAALSQYGYPPNRLIGMPLEQLHVPERGDSVRTRLSEALEYQVLYETEHRRADGTTFPVEVSARSVRRNRDVEVLAIIRDLSERRRREMQTQISQRMEVLGQLAGGVAHDFNNLLTAIRGFSAMVLESLSPDDPRHGYLEEVVLASDRAAELTSKLLSFSRGYAVEKKSIDLNRVVQGMEALFRRLVREDIHVVLQLADDPIWIRADPRQIETLLMNLVVNSRDAMPKGGTITIRTHLRVSRGPEDIGEPLHGQLVVEDTGIGMSEEVRVHAFDPFFTTKSAGQGTGLGLATVFGIVQQHEGRVWIDSAPGEGTRVFVEIPVCSPTPSEEMRALQAVEGHLVGGSETILLVEDHPDVRSYVHTVLESFGYRVLVARDANQAMEMLSKPQKESIDLLVSDVVMPGGNGIELWKKARSILPNLPVLFITGYAERSLFQAAALPREAPLLQKPFRANELARKVREVLDRHKPMAAR